MAPSTTSDIGLPRLLADRKSTRLNSSHLVISYAVFCLKKKHTIALVLPLRAPHPEHRATSTRTNVHLPALSNNPYPSMHLSPTHASFRHPLRTQSTLTS